LSKVTFTTGIFNVLSRPSLLLLYKVIIAPLSKLMI